MQKKNFKIPYSYLNQTVILQKENAFTLEGVEFSIGIELSEHDTFFKIRITAKTDNKHPLEALIEGNILLSNQKNTLIKKQVIFDDANSDIILFPYTLKQICQLLINKPLELTIGIGPPENPTLNNTKQSLNNNPVDPILNKNSTKNSIITADTDPNEKSAKEDTISSPTNKKGDKANLNNNQSIDQEENINKPNADDKNLFNKDNKNKANNDDDEPTETHGSSIDGDTENITYNGLYNQGATCYINSAIQSLFHLPLFRKIIYEIPTENETDKAHSVPLNLQCLFYNLQFSKSTCSTKMLTTSFGWEKGEVYRQQDIGEFLKKLISLLDDLMKKIPGMKGKIAFLFEGKTVQTIKNDSTGSTSQTEEIFYDLSVDVKNTLENSLKKFTKEEHISDYVDSQSPTPQIVKYQTLLLNLPRVLQIQIKRYKYSAITGEPEKIDSKMQYFEDLDLAPFMSENSPKQCTKYKLYGVIVHCGVASGGHYYIYCKPEMKKDWYEFNDSYVHPVKAKEALENNYGGTYDYTRYTKAYIWEKDYSAYMLIYIRVDAIKEVFQSIESDQIPQHIKSYTEDVNQIEMNRRKSDPECQINFTTYTEQCIWENCKLGIASFINQNYCIKSTIDKRSEAKDLYQDVANQMKINVDCLRLWLIDNDRQTFKKIINLEDKLTYLRTQYIFAQIKDGKDELLKDKYYRTYFLVLYTPMRAKPFFFFQTMNSITKLKRVSSTSAYLYDYEYLTYEKIISDAIHILNKNPLFKFNKKNASLYLIKSDDIEKIVYTYKSCDEPSGTMMILQISDPDNSLDDTNINSLKSKLNIKGKFKRIKLDNNTDESDNATHRYFDFMTNELPKTVDKYFEIRNCTIKANVYDYSNISHLIGAIEFPTLKPKELEEFIKIAFDLKFKEKAETLLLFAKEENDNVPKSKPFNIKTYGNEKIESDKLNNIYILCTSKKVGEDFSSETRVIQLSKDACSISKTLCYYMSERDTHPFEQFIMFNEDFFNNAQTRMFTIDENNQCSRIIKDEYQENLITINNKTKLRIEIVPDDQVNQKLMLIYKGYVDDLSKIQIIEDPFYFAYIPDETVSLLKSRISKLLQCGQNFKVYKGSGTYYFDKYVIQDKVNFERYDYERKLYILFDVSTT